MRLYNKIRIIFLISFLLLSALFAAYVYIQKIELLDKNEKRYMQTSRFSLEFFRNSRKDGKTIDFKDENFYLFLKENSFELIPKEKLNNIVKYATIIKTHTLKRVEIKILRYKKSFYLYLTHPKITILLKDKKQLAFAKNILLLYISAILFLLTLYFWLLKSLKPLKNLHHSIQKVAQGDLSVSFRSKENDEIAQVSNAFDEALRQIESLVASRQLFLRTIMHELKTPIAKGRLLNEFLSNPVEKENYDAVFERLEILLDEFSKIEQMLSSSYQLKLNPYNIHEMINQAIELMILDDTEINNQIAIRQIKPFILKTDFGLFSLALKNLIDNAIKYSSNHHVNITIYQDKIQLTNKADKFTENLNEYTQPFNPKAQGFGLGLYIVHNIIELLKLKIEYTHVEGENIFWIKKVL